MSKRLKNGIIEARCRANITDTHANMVNQNQNAPSLVEILAVIKPI
jgi:hypothetical protein